MSGLGFVCKIPLLAHALGLSARVRIGYLVYKVRVSVRVRDFRRALQENKGKKVRCFYQTRSITRIHEERGVGARARKRGRWLG